jgi:hypothetical protein
MEAIVDAVFIIVAIVGFLAICVRGIVSTETWNRRVLRRAPPLNWESEAIKSLQLISVLFGVVAAAEALRWVIFGGSGWALFVVFTFGVGAVWSAWAATRLRRRGSN